MDAFTKRQGARILALVCFALQICGAYSTTVAADEIRVAVASNFSNAARALAQHFTHQSGHKVMLVFGASGKHYAQIRNGAPFDAFFSADVKRPERLEKEGLIVPDSRFTYAVGKLVLWSPDPHQVDATGAILENGDFRHLAMANPKLAPYGRAAQEVLKRLGHGQRLQNRIVRGENIGQTFQYVKSGNAELGFVAYSQIKYPDRPITGSWWAIPDSLYDAIDQQAVLLKENSSARAFLEFVRSRQGREIIRSFGYETP